MGGLLSGSDNAQRSSNPNGNLTGFGMLGGGKVIGENGGALSLNLNGVQLIEKGNGFSNVRNLSGSELFSNHVSQSGGISSLFNNLGDKRGGAVLSNNSVRGDNQQQGGLVSSGRGGLFSVPDAKNSSTSTFGGKESNIIYLYSNLFHFSPEISLFWNAIIT
mgnify:FL=1